MIVLEDANGNRKEVGENEPYNRRVWHPIHGYQTSEEHDSVDAVELIRQIEAELEAEGIHWGDVLKMLFKPAALLLGKSYCMSCEVRKVILNSASKLIKKLGKVEAYVAMKGLIRDSFSKDSVGVLKQLKEILGD